ncbi:type II toxin-antitoxin system death-on-curing family toxin [Deinococcus fonticola]|uniref:type II toxin-antitoxin system death-on-curing family toxin n=1 Tax=Deinococcus fonticola TaxID=2528713 RepID=UPI0010757704|nr:type II toxin-antitoxin system death-on-curing family toxin [Deinococcus fonticola]
MTCSVGWLMPEGLTRAEVEELHNAQLERYGGSPGLRDPGLLESALAQPVQELFGQLRHPSVAAQAAAYLYYLSRAHAFMDANKRTALSCALVWLALHDLRLRLNQDELFDLTLAVAQGQLSLEETVERFERSVW